MSGKISKRGRKEAELGVPRWKKKTGTLQG